MYYQFTQSTSGGSIEKGEEEEIKSDIYVMVVLAGILNNLFFLQVVI